MKIKVSFLAIVAMVLVLGTGVVQAFPIYPGIGLLGGAQFEDDNIDYFVDSDAPGTPGYGLITVGDVLVSAVEMTKVIDVLPPGLGTTYNLNQPLDELVALAQIKVIPSLPGDPAGRIRFGEVAPGVPMVEFFSGLGLANLDVATGPLMAAGTAAVTDGAPLWAFSITGDADTEWFFDPILAGANNPTAVSLLGPGSKVGSLNLALNQVAGVDIFNLQAITGCAPGFFGCLGDGLVDLVGSGDILGGLGFGYDQLANPTAGFARSDADFVVNVPEPAVISLLGLGLLGLGAVGRRRSRK